MNKTVKTIAIILGIIVLIGLISPKEEVKNSVKPSPTPTVVPTITDNESMFGNEDYTKSYTKRMEMDYLEGCLNKDESNRAFCLCSLLMLEKNYSASEVQELYLSGQLEEGKIPQKIIDIASYCVEKFPY